jgi:hypothetical protein
MAAVFRYDLLKLFETGKSHMAILTHSSNHAAATAGQVSLAPGDVLVSHDYL